MKTISNTRQRNPNGYVYVSEGALSNLRFYFSALLMTLLLMSCGDTSDKTHDHTTAVQYTCPMHPQVVQHEPGTCPICGMDLVKVSKSETNNNELMVSDTQIRLANITTERVSRKAVGETVVVNGTLTVDEDKTEAISTRVAGRVEKLYVKETGRSIRKGQPLYVLYSEALMTLQQEYMLAKEQHDLMGKTEKRYRAFMQAAARKLLLYGLSSAQIEKLDRKTSLEPRITFFAPAAGIVTRIDATEGQYLPEGGPLFRIQDISTLWVEAELYPNETSLVKRGDKVSVKVMGSASPAIDATINFVSPEYKANSRILIVRAQMNNSNLEFIPGQQVQVSLMPSSRDAISVPTDAVIRDGKGSHVYVKSNHNTFQPKMVKTGIEALGSVEITQGLNEGDTLAVTGAYLLYSEMILKRGVDPMSGHDH